MALGRPPRGGRAHREAPVGGGGVRGSSLDRVPHTFPTDSSPPRYHESQARAIHRYRFPIHALFWFSFCPTGPSQEGELTSFEHSHKRRIARSFSGRTARGRGFRGELRWGRDNLTSSAVIDRRTSHGALLLASERFDLSSAMRKNRPVGTVHRSAITR